MSSWEEYKKKKQKNKNISTNVNSTKQVSTPTTNTTNWNNVINRANQMLANTRNVSNLVNVENPLLIKSQANVMTEEQAKSIASIDDSKKRFEAISKLSNNRQQYQKNAMQVNTIRETEKSKKEAEKINKDIAKGNYLSSAGHILKGLPKGALDAVTKLTLTAANLNPNTKDSKEMMEAGKLLTSRYSDTTSQINNKIVQGGARVSDAIGAMLPAIATGLVGGPAGLVNAINVGASSYMETLNEEQDNKLKSLLTGTVKGTLSYNIEKLAGGNFLGKGSLDDLAKMGISKVKSDIGKRIASKLYEVGGEIAEENLENITGYVVDKLINDKDISMEQFISDLKQTTGDTAVTTLVLSALGLGGDTYNQSKINEVIDNSSLSNEQKSALKNVVEKDNASLEEVQELIGKTSENQSTTMQNNEILKNNKQVIQQTQQTAQNLNSQQINSNNKMRAILPNSNYKFEISGNKNIDNLRQDASKYFNNSNETKNLINSLEKISTEKNYSIRFDDTITDSNGRFANGKIQKIDGETIITLNPNSNKAFEFIIGHEIGHAITTPEMKKLVIDFASKNTEFNNAIETLKQTYNVNEITDEVVSDIEAQLLGNQEFINSLSLEKPNIFKQIYDVIISIANKITGNSNEALFIRDLKNKYQKAYREIQGSNIEEGNTNYSIAGKKAMNNIVNKDLKYKVVEESYNRAVKMASKNIDNETIRQQTNWFQDKNGDWKFEFSDKDMSLKNMRFEENKIYKLKEVLEHDALFLLYPELQDYNVSFVKKKSGNASFNKDTKSIKINKDMLFSKNGKLTVEGSLIHEIQHAIQSIENFEAGTSRKKSGLAYYNKLGEIEADNTKQRYLQEKEGFFNRDVVAPESSKINPKHSKLDNYLKNRKLVDKIKDSVYNYFNDKIRNEENKYEDYQENYSQDKIRNNSLVDERRNLTDGEKKNQGLEESSSFSMQKDILNSIEDIKNKYKDETQYLILSENDKSISINNMVVKNELRNQGIGQKILNDIIEYANRNNKTITLTPTTEFNTQNKLKKWYKANGFVENKGRNTDFLISDTMYKLPTENPDIRYSKENAEWEKYLKENFKSEGTKTYKEQIGLSEEVTNNKVDSNTIGKASSKSQIKSIDKYNKYKENIIKKNEETINNLISYKNDSVRSIEKSILEKEKILNSKKNKDTKIANTLKMQIESLKNRKTEIENIYYEKIDKFNTKINKEKLEIEVQKQMKKDARETISLEIKPLLQGSDKWKDKKMGALYNREIAQRNIEDIIENKEEAELVNKTIFDPIQIHIANATRDANNLFKRINDLNLDKKKKYTYIEKEAGKDLKILETGLKTIKVDEATLAQLYIEKKINEEDLKKYNVDIEKIKNTAEVFREILNNLYDQMNEVVVKYGYAPIGKIENYFPHFTEDKSDTVIGKIASLLNIDIKNQELPTEIAGQTENFKPGKSWNSNLLKRLTDRTDYDALKIMEKYILGAEDIIHVTEDIQRLRQFQSELRYKFSEKGIQEEVDKIRNNDEFTVLQQEEAIENLLSDKNARKHQLSHFVTWLDEYTNILANKKNSGDREFEKEYGRVVYTTIPAIESRIAANAIGGNIGVAMTNIAPIVQACSTMKFGNVLTGMLETTMKDMYSFVGRKDSSYVSYSNFLTNRLGTDKITQKTISDYASGLPSGIDMFIAESIVRAKYRENLQNGMNEENALQNADKYARKLMADRSKGSLPIYFTKKNPLSKLVTMFQVEPNNIVSNYLKDMPREVKNKKQLAFNYAKLMGGSYVFNTLRMAITGGNEVLPDPIRMVTYLAKWLFSDDEDEKEQAKTDIVESLVSTIPFASNVAGLFGMEDVGRIPISNAMPNISNIQSIRDKDVATNYKIETALKEISKPILYLGLPVGGAQLNKTIQGIATMIAGGSYKTNKEGEKQLQFPTERNVGNVIKSTLFGKYSISNAKEYIDSGFKGLDDKETAVYDKSNMDFYQLKDYFSYGKQKDITKIDKINYINDNMSNISTEDKWNIFEYNIISSTEREDGTSQLTDAKYAIENNIATKEEYMKLYEDAEKNEVGFPDEEKLKELKENDFDLKTYMKYKTEAKIKGQEKKEKFEKQQKSMLPISEEEQIKSKSLNDTDKINIIKQSKYTEEEKDRIYVNEIGKEDDVYTSLKLLNKGNNRINDYLDYKTADLSSDKKDDGTKNGKTIRGSAEEKFNKYMNNSNFSGIERLYLRGTEYKLENWERKQLQSYVKTLNLTKSEQDEIYKSLSSTNIVEMKDGSIKWKN